MPEVISHQSAHEWNGGRGNGVKLWPQRLDCVSKAGPHALVFPVCFADLTIHPQRTCQIGPEGVGILLRQRSIDLDGFLCGLQGLLTPSQLAEPDGQSVAATRA